MPTLSIASRAVRALLVSFLAVAPVFAAGAQSSAYDLGSTAIVSGGSDGCFSRGDGQVSAACRFGSASASLTLDALRSPLFHAGASTNAVDQHAEGAMYLNDRFTFLGDVVPTELRFDVFLHGGVQGTSSYGQFNLYEGNFSEPAATIELTSADVTNYTTGTFVTMLWGDMRSIDVGFGLDALASNRAFLGGTGGASADFLHTAGFLRVRAFDANGEQITRGLVVQTASGYTYPFEGAAVVTAAPEPATLALLAAGVLPLVALARRRRA